MIRVVMNILTKQMGLGHLYESPELDVLLDDIRSGIYKIYASHGYSLTRIHNRLHAFDGP